MTLMRVYPIGVMRMVDSDSQDDKIIAIPFSDPIYNEITSIDQLPSHIFDEMMHFFSVYKQLESKTTAVKTLFGRDVAEQIIQEAIDAYKKKFGSEPSIHMF
jgi:inorganic pyrophosphatase